jgi:hypothetical protein
VPLDHYVSQVHLRKFYSPKLGPLMYAIRKSDLARFTPNAQSVCRTEDGSTNPYLHESRAIEEFLKGVEPKYEGAVAALLANQVDAEAIYAIAGFVGYVLSCSPGGMRIHMEPMKALLDITAKAVDSQGLVPPPPPELAGDGLTDLLRRGKLRFEVDPKYPQALGVASIVLRTVTFGNFTWEVLLNSTDSPFFTSDFPVAIETVGGATTINRIVPLAPNLAIRIRPQPLAPHERIDFSFSRFRSTIKEVSRHEAISLNRLIVRCAETTVFFRDDHSWVFPFVKKNSSFRIEPRTIGIPHGKG